MDINDVINKTILQLDLEGSPGEIAEAKEHFKEKLHKTVINTLLNNLTKDQQEKFLDILKNQQDPSTEIEKLAASVPGLLGQITDALDREVKLVRMVFGKK